MIALLIVWLLYWSDLLFYWSDPVQCPSSVFTSIRYEEPKVGEKEYEKKFAIIGAGFCGLGLAAACKRYGIPFDSFEKNECVGGNWYNGVYGSFCELLQLLTIKGTVHIISSRKTTEYKDYPMPESYGDFPSAQQMFEYFNNYAKHWDIMKHIEFNSEVISCKKIEGDKWEITIKRKDGETEKRVYKGIIIANGHHWDMRIPSHYPGEFTGEVLHSKQYKNRDQLEGKRVLVVGGGNSACDLAVEAARFAKEAHISMRRGYWFMPRTLFGIPLVELIKPWMPMWLQRLILRIVLRIVVGRYENYGLQAPDHKIFEHHPTINSELLNTIKLGDIKPHKDIKSFSGKTVTFVDGTSIEVDLIIYCTGYHLTIPLLKDYIPRINGIPQLVAGSFPYEHKNCYFLGLGQVRYGAGPFITLGSMVIAKSILVQEKLKNPIGLVMTKMGAKCPQKCEHSADVLVDPHEAWKRGMISWKIMLNLLPSFEKLFTSLGMLK